MSGAIGIIGVGHLAAFLVEGIRHANRHLDVLLSPRNAVRALALAKRFDVTVAADNAAVVAGSSTVVLATRPADAAAAIRGLPWRENQTLVSVAAGIPLAVLEPAAAPARVVRAMPISAATINESPTAIFPNDANARSLFARLGTVHAMADEATFEAASVMGALYGWVFALVDEVARWAAAAGIGEAEARGLTALTFRGAAGMMLEHMDEPLPAMLESLATPGGITCQGLEKLGERGALSAWSEACEAVLARVRENGA